MAKPFGIGIVGLGWVAGAHIDTFKRIPGVQVVGVSSRRALDPKGPRSHVRAGLIYGEQR